MTAPVDSPTPEVPAVPALEAPAAATEDVNSLPQWARDSLSKANREAASYRTQVQELKPRADQFAALEEASKSDAQRLQESVAQAQRDAESARAEAIRYKAAATHGIPVEHFDLLGTGTEEQVTANAQKVAALLAAQVAAVTPPAPVTPGRLSVEQMRPGATPAGTESEEDVAYAKLFGPPK